VWDPETFDRFSLPLLQASSIDVGRKSRDLEEKVDVS